MSVLDLNVRENAFTAWRREPKREEFAVEGTPFVLELEEILSGPRLLEIDDARATRKAKGKPALKSALGYVPSDVEIDYATWLEFCCVGVWQETEAGRVRVEENLRLVEILRAGQQMKDGLLAAGLHAQLMTVGGDILEKKDTTSPATEDLPASSSAPVSGSDAPPENSNGEESPSPMS